MLFRVLNGVMAALFAVAVVVQYNDPDPARWMALYGAACVVALIVAVRRTVSLAASATVGLIALVWLVYWLSISQAGLSTYAHMFDAWEMSNEPIEEAREACGLLVVVAWMAVIAVRSRKSSFLLLSSHHMERPRRFFSALCGICLSAFSLSA